MTDAPERIWLDWPVANRGEPVYDEPPERDTDAGQTCYVRADLYEAQAAEIARLREALKEIAETPTRRYQRKIARAALMSTPPPPR